MAAGTERTRPTPTPNADTSRTLPLSLTLTLSLALSLTLTLPLTLSLSLSLTLPLTLSLTLFYKSRRPRSPFDAESGRLVAEVGLEPTRPCGHRILSPARLPIPPLGQRSGDYSRTALRRIPARLVVDRRVR